MTISEATAENLRRKSAYVDKVQSVGSYPLFSWVDLNLTELCNRSGGSPKACVFCPRIDPTFYPNQRLHMPVPLARKIARELQGLDYRGVVVLCGFGEPMLHPKLDEIVSLFKGVRVELVTNGDYLTVERIRELRAAGVSYFVVSLYDGPHQVADMGSRFAQADCREYLLRDRWHSEQDNYGLKLTNRAGTIDTGQQDPVDVRRPCYYLAYQMTIDWQGDVLLCPQDWNKRVRFGNVASQSLFEVWSSMTMHKRRRQLASGPRNQAPCNGCNTDGTLHGHNHCDAFGIGRNVRVSEAV